MGSHRRRSFPHIEAISTYRRSSHERSNYHTSRPELVNSKPPPTMLGPELDVESALPAWNHLNDVSLFDIAPREILGRGVGLVACRNLNREEGSSEAVTLARIPRSLILSGEAVEAHAKVDGHFRELLDAVGRKVGRLIEQQDYWALLRCFFLLHLSVCAPAGSRALVLTILQSTRGDVCLFLLTQSVLAAAPASGGVATPFTEYVKFLPTDIPLPSLWSEQERRLLSGTSLEVGHVMCPKKSRMRGQGRSPPQSPT